MGISVADDFLVIRPTWFVRDGAPHSYCISPTGKVMLRVKIGDKCAWQDPSADLTRGSYMPGRAVQAPQAVATPFHELFGQRVLDACTKIMGRGPTRGELRHMAAWRTAAQNRVDESRVTHRRHRPRVA